MSEPVSIKVEIDIACVYIANAPVNALGSAVRTGLRDAFNELSKNNEIKAILLLGSGRCFSAGADISEFGKEPPASTPTLPETIEAVEESRVPVIAGIHGFAFGGGLELAMGAHYRVALSGTKLGLTEVDLGIIPGAGGTQRLPRLIGVEDAATLITAGTRFDAAKAHDFGLIDHLAEGDDIDAATRAFAETLIKDAKGPRPTSARTDKIEDAETAKHLLAKMRGNVSNRAKGRIAPLRALESIEAAATLSFADGMKREREIFLELRDGREARAMRHLFKAERDAQKVDGLSKEYKPREIKRAGVIGLGTMGRGIALVMARAGIDVTAIELEQSRVDAGLSEIRKGLEDRVKRGRMSEDQMKAELARISGSTDYTDLADADLVIEAALEDMAIKKEIFAALDLTCKPDAILTTNTSSLDIDEIASATNRPALVAGAHFFAPAQVMRLLEIIRGSATSDETMADMMALSKRIGKVGVGAGNTFGFVANRMYHRYTWQAYFLLQEGAEPADVDNAMQDFGFALGCLAVGDISGLDVAWSVRKAQREIGDIDPDAPYPVIADRICEKGWLGRKTGRGWYRYDDGKAAPDPEVSELIKMVSAELGITRRVISKEEIQERCLFALINEGARLLGLGTAIRASDIDVIWRYGFGFPIWRGGPMFAAEDLGLASVLETLVRLRNEYGPAFEPGPLIVERVRAGKETFGD